MDSLKEHTSPMDPDVTPFGIMFFRDGLNSHTGHYYAANYPFFFLQKSTRLKNGHLYCCNSTSKSAKGSVHIEKEDLVLATNSKHSVSMEIHEN